MKKSLVKHTVTGYLQEVGDVVRHLLDLSVVELLDISHVLNISLHDEVDTDTLSTETTRTTDTMDVVLTVWWHVIVDDKGHLLDIDTTSEQVSGDQHTG